jgi:hypothetical protein
LFQVLAANDVRGSRIEADYDIHRLRESLQSCAQPIGRAGVQIRLASFLVGLFIQSENLFMFVSFAQELRYLVRDSVLVFQLAFPQHKNRPTEPAKLAKVFGVSRSVSSDLALPVI